MIRKKLALIPAVAAAAAFLILPASAGATGEPTCSTTLGIANHGEHIIADYITGIGRDNYDWPAGGIVGQTVSANGGALVPGAPGPGSHFIHGFAPGASFCLDQSQAPGAHPGP